MKNAKIFILLGLLVLGFVLLLPSNRAHAAITLDSTSSATSVIAGSQTSLSWSHTVHSGANRILLVMIAGLGSGDPTSVTYGSSSLSLVKNCGGWTCAVWELVDAPIGTRTITVHFPALTQSYDTMSASGIVFDGVNQTAPINTSTSNAAATSTSVNTMIANSWLLGVMVYHNGTSTPATGQTDIQTYQNVAGAPEIAIAYQGPVSKGSNTMGWTVVGGTGAEGISLVALNPTTIRAGGSYSGGTLSIQNINPSILSEELMSSNYAQAGGDTVNYTAWSASSTCAGAFNGGCVYGQWNDGSFTGTSGSHALAITQLVNYNPSSTASTTVSVVNSMSSYGALATNMPGCDNARTYKSRDPWFLNGKLYLSFFCMDNTTFAGYGAGIVVSPDAGAHWCNYATYTNNGDVCNSSDWDATGNAPTSTAGFQWPGTDPGNDSSTKMDRLGLFQTCQEQSINCPTIPGLNTNYMYFQGTSAGGGAFYIMRIAKTADPMIPSNWQGYDNGLWGSVQSSTDQGNGISWYGGTFIWSPAYKLFLATIHTGVYIGFASAPLPWGPWTQDNSIPKISNGLGFPTFILATMKTNTSTHDINIVIAADNQVAGDNVQFELVDLGPYATESTVMMA